MFLDEENKVKYVKYLEQELGLLSPEGWKDVSNVRIQELNLPPLWKYKYSKIYVC